MKPSRKEDELQPLAPETNAITRDIIGETHPNPVATGSAGTRVHIVQEGETLASIARHYYGDERQANRIVEANRDRLNDEERPEPGAELRIPV